MTADVVEGAVASRSGIWRERLRGALGNQQVLLLLVLVALVAYFTQRQSLFFSKSVLTNILNDWAPLVLIAIGETFVIVSGGIDLSVGSTLMLSGIVAALAIRSMTRGGHGEDFSLFVGLLAATGIGLSVGVVNGLLITKAKLVPFIATLGMLGIAGGLSLVLTKGGPIGRGPADTVSWVVPDLWAFSWPVIIIIVVVLVLGLFLHLARFGRYTFAVGSNPFAARAAGIVVDRHIWKVYALSGALAGWAGMFFYLRLSVGSASTGLGTELDAIAATVIGGAALSGGAARITGTVLGAGLLTTIYSGLVIINVDEEWKAVVVGVLIVASAALQSLRPATTRAS
jgi:ribose transport system permease protein